MGSSCLLIATVIGASESRCHGLHYAATFRESCSGSLVPMRVVLYPRLSTVWHQVPLSRYSAPWLQGVGKRDRGNHPQLSAAVLVAHGHNGARDRAVRHE